MTYLNIGIGNACAWQSNAKFCPISLINILPFESVEKEGAFAATGSKNSRRYVNIVVPTWKPV